MTAPTQTDLFNELDPPNNVVQMSFADVLQPYTSEQLEDTIKLLKFISNGLFLDHLSYAIRPNAVSIDEGYQDDLLQWEKFGRRGRQPKPLGWPVKKWNDITKSSRNKTYYVSISSFVPQHSRKDDDWAALHFIVLDDIGTKAPVPSLKPTYIIETSLDNFQYGYCLKEFITDKSLAYQLIKTIYSSNATDNGGSVIGKFVRLPLGINGKKMPDGSVNQFNVRLIEFNQVRYTPDQLLNGLELKLVDKVKPKVYDVADVDADNLDDPIYLHLIKKGLVKSAPSDKGIVAITCPFVASHTDMADNGTVYWIGGGFKCHHGHCADRKRDEFLDAIEFVSEFKVYTNKNELVNAFNKRFAQQRCDAAIYDIEKNNLIKESTFNQITRGSYYLYENSKGQTTRKNASEIWLAEPNRQRVNEYVFNEGPSIQDGLLNIFKGFPKHSSEIVQEYVDEIRYHILHRLCLDNVDRAEAYIKIEAWKIQNIGKPSRVIVAMKSDNQQVGKGLISDDLLNAVWGERNCYTAVSHEDIVGQFTGHLVGKSHQLLEEACFAGKHNVHSTLIGRSTQSAQSYHVKMLTPTDKIPCANNYTIHTNITKGFHVARGDSRYFILDMDNAPSHGKGVQEFAKKMKANLNGYASSWFNYLRAYPLGEFLPWDALTYGCDKSVFEDATDDAGFMTFLNEFEKVLPSSWCVNSRFHKDKLRFSSMCTAYHEWARNAYGKPESATACGRVLTKLGFETVVIKDGKKAHKCRILPSNWCFDEEDDNKT